jgi:plasmid stability protein
MASVTLKDLPRTLHMRLKLRAQRNGRSLDQEVIRTLEEATMADETDVAELDKRIDALRASLPRADHSKVNDWRLSPPTTPSTSPLG